MCLLPLRPRPKTFLPGIVNDLIKDHGERKNVSYGNMLGPIYHPTGVKIGFCRSRNVCNLKNNVYPVILLIGLFHITMETKCKQNENEALLKENGMMI